MTLQLLKSKLHRACVTDASFDYQGSLGIHTSLLEKVGILPYEKILVGNITRGSRFETYAIPLNDDPKAIVINGAAAHLGAVGDRLVIMAFAHLAPDEAKNWHPTIFVLDHNNQPIANGT